MVYTAKELRSKGNRDQYFLADTDTYGPVTVLKGRGFAEFLETCGWDDSTMELSDVLEVPISCVANGKLVYVDIFQAIDGTLYFPNDRLSDVGELIDGYGEDWVVTRLDTEEIIETGSWNTCEAEPPEFRLSVSENTEEGK